MYFEVLFIKNSSQSYIHKFSSYGSTEVGGILWSSILTDEDQLLKKGAMKFVTAPDFKYKLIKEDGTVKGSPEKNSKTKEIGVLYLFNKPFISRVSNFGISIPNA